MHPDAAVARAMATRIINEYAASPAIPNEVNIFIQGVVRDALVIAPQPVTDSWTSGALSTVAGLVRFVLGEGGPLTREHVFDLRTRNRFLYVYMAQKGYKENSVSGYRGRLDLIVLGMAGAVARDIHDRPRLMSSVATEPLKRADEAALWTWSRGLRPVKRNQRTGAGIILGLGLGARTPEMPSIKDTSVRVDPYGVHVKLENAATGSVRVVTCRNEFEDRLLALVEATPPGNPLISPWRTEPMADNTLGVGLWQAQERFEPPVYFNLTTLRNTWLVRHIESGTPLPLLLEIAELETMTSIIRLLPYCETRPPAASAAAMRRA
jgi:hypothetical protein